MTVTVAENNIINISGVKMIYAALKFFCL